LPAPLLPAEPGPSTIPIDPAITAINNSPRGASTRPSPRLSSRQSPATELSPWLSPTTELSPRLSPTIGLLIGPSARLSDS
jgi:hypothetical protein